MTRQQRRQLQRLLDSIPEMVSCTGECWRACGPVPMLPAEWEHVVARLDQLGLEVPKALVERDGETLMCPLLDADRRCSIYSHRPSLCRLWGVAQGMPCVAGCEPERALTDVQAFGILEKIRRLLPGDIMGFPA